MIWKIQNYNFHVTSPYNLNKSRKQNQCKTIPNYKYLQKITVILQFLVSKLLKLKRQL